MDIEMTGSVSTGVIFLKLSLSIQLYSSQGIDCRLRPRDLITLLRECEAGRMT